MSIASGLAAQMGIANETTPGTPVAVSTFTEFTSEKLELRPNFAQGNGLHAGGLTVRAARRALVSADAGGDVTFDLPTKGLGKWMQAMMGSTTTATQLASTAAYQQIHNVGSADGKTFTLQKGVPDTGATVDPLTLAGCKVTGWTLTSSANAIATLAVTVDALTMSPTGAGALGLQTASYSASTAMYSFLNVNPATFSAYTVVSGLWTPTSPTPLVNVRGLTLKGGQPKDTTRWVAGTQAKAEQLTNNFQPITGTIDIDFASMALYNQFAANTSTGLVIPFTGAQIAAPYNYTLAFVMPAVFFEQGSTPMVSGPGVVTVSYPFSALDDGTNGALQVQIISTDTAV